MRSFLVLILGVVSVVVAAEIGLRLTSFVRSQPAAEEPSEIDHRIQIVALGESTTAPSFVNGRDVSWPSQLETILNAELKKRNSKLWVQVKNLGQAGISTPFLVRAFKRQVARDKVDVLVTMMGVNDSKIATIRTGFLFEHSFVFRFAYWAIEAWQCPACYVVKKLEGLTPIQRKALFEIKAYLDEKPIETLEQLAELQEEIARLQAKYGAAQDPINMHAAWRIFHETESARRNLDSAFVEAGRDEIEKLLKLSHPRLMSQNSPMLLTCLLASRRNQSCLAKAEEAVERGLVPSPVLLTALASSLEGVQEYEAPLVVKFVRSRGLKVHSEKGDLAGLRSSYASVRQITGDKNIAWFAMQYPTGKITGLEWILSEPPRAGELNFREVFYRTTPPADSESGLPYLVSNESFALLADGPSPQDYFTDFFARAQGLNFGHTTEKGHALIAENLAKEILRHWPEIEKSHRH